MRDSYQDTPGQARDASVRRLGRLTWRATQLVGGSTGLGLDIARRIAEVSGGTMTIGRSASGGGSVTLGFGPPAAMASGTRHRRVGLLHGWRL